MEKVFSKKILIISTGGTFNNKYNPKLGKTEVCKNGTAVKQILKNFHNLDYSFKNLLHKDSNYLTDQDKLLLTQTISQSSLNKIVIVHGTDTMENTAHYLDNRIKNKKIILTGSMIPFRFDFVEATANFSMGIGYLLNENTKNGVYISMHGAVKKSNLIYKNRKRGLFMLK